MSAPENDRADPRTQPWRMSHRADPAACRIADRHYSRQKIGSPQFVPPGRCVVLVTECGKAVWVTSWPFAEFVKHAWAGTWVCSIFRNEGAGLSSVLITAAVASTRFYWAPPSEGLVTFVDRDRTRPKRDPGRCFRRAGFQEVGATKGGLVALQLLPERMPDPAQPLGTTADMFAVERVTG